MSVQTIVLFVIQCALVFGISTYGSDCKNSRDCHFLQFCDKGSCRCSKGFVKYKDECFPVKAYGEECLHDVQCNDSRMACASDEIDFQEKRFCFCDMYHMWNSTANECLDVTVIAQTGGSFREVYNVTGKLERSAEKVFLGVVVAGLLFVSILLSFIGICSIYGCCQKRKGRYGEDDAGKDQINEVAIIGLPAGTYEAIETDFSAMDI